MRGMDKPNKPFTAGDRVLSLSTGHAGIVIRSVFHREYGWRVHYYVPGPATYRALASDLRLCPYCAADEDCAYHVGVPS